MDKYNDDDDDDKLIKKFELNCHSLEMSDYMHFTKALANIAQKTSRRREKEPEREGCTVISMNYSK